MEVEEIGSTALQAVDKIDDGFFKKPKVPTSRKKKKILDEDTYVRELEKIIERDFFPDLENLRDKLEFVRAKENNDIDKLREFYIKYSGGREPNSSHRITDSPATFETPVNQTDTSTDTPCRQSANSEDEQLASVNENTHSETASQPDSVKSKKDWSLDEFMSCHTSEDNESFEHLMEESQVKFRLKHAWLFEAEEKHNKKHLPNLALASAEEQQAQNRLAICGVSDTTRDIRPRELENWQYKTFNSVMYIPDHVPSNKKKQVEEAKCKPREVVLPNTRFETNPFTESLSHSAYLEASAIQQSKKEGKVGVDGKELGKETPRINGYNFVRTPSPAPGVDASPLMTWGEVEGTPFQLDGSQTPLLGKATPGPSYKIPAVPDRERIGLELAEKANQKHRDKKNKAILAAKSRLVSPALKLGHHTSMEKLAAFSPAVQKLSSKLGVHQKTDKALRASYTPSPSSRLRKPTPTAELTKILHTTPSRLPVTPKTPGSRRIASGVLPVDTGLTDNLLNLPRRSQDSSADKTKSPQQSADEEFSAQGTKRKCAADFF
ncbi:ess-2 splicing factor homolog [Oratosquilla oratoria]|uniref:ess-2 splicing factor homolog n=1 Tax=Oratosquilla oratoria TaxID=337810 RepID=UPI003F77510E